MEYYSNVPLQLFLGYILLMFISIRNVFTLVLFYMVTAISSVYLDLDTLNIHL